MTKLFHGRAGVHRQMVTAIVSVVFGVILLCWVLNTSFLEKVYMHSKTQEIIDAFSLLSENTRDNTLYSKEFYVTFENLCAGKNLSIIVISSDGTVLLSSQNEASMLRNQLFNSLLDIKGKSKVLASDDSYVVKRQVDIFSNQDNIFLVGSLADGNTILIRSAVDSIRDSAKISNRFLLVMGLVGVLLAFFVSEVVARWITKPVVELTKLSKKMAALDFDAKYEPRKRRNEVDELGEQMNMLSENLERTIGDLKGANASLQHDLTLREESERMRKEFLSNVSHELKTPIALIQGYAEGLQEGVSDDPESQAYYCEVISDEAKKMNQMVQQLLTLNQLEFGEQQFLMERFDVVPMIRSVMQASHILLENQGITAEYEGADSCYVWADPFWSEQVFTNYFSNAIHHCEGQKQISVCLSEQEGNAHIEVYNTGTPIPEESIPRLWEKFYKVDKARSREYGGSGIGLSVVKAVMDGFGKKYGVENHENGVSFWFELDK